MFEERNSALYYKFAGDDVEHLSESGNDDEKATTSLKWIGFKNQFFSTAFIADGKFNDGAFTSETIKEGKYLKRFHAESTIDYDSKEPQVAGFNIFLGPNSYPLLSSYDDGRSGDQTLDLDKLVPLGYKFFRWINTLIVIPVFTFLGKFFSNYGIIILLLTIFIKLVLFPFTYKSYKSQARMRVLAPQIKEINDKYPGRRMPWSVNGSRWTCTARPGSTPWEAVCRCCCRCLSSLPCSPSSPRRLSCGVNRSCG